MLVIPQCQLIIFLFLCVVTSNMYTSSNDIIYYQAIRSTIVLRRTISSHDSIFLKSGKADDGSHHHHHQSSPRQHSALTALFLPVPDLYIPSLPDCLLPFTSSERPYVQVVDSS